MIGACSRPTTTSRAIHVNTESFFSMGDDFCSARDRCHWEPQLEASRRVCTAWMHERVRKRVGFSRSAAYSAFPFLGCGNTTPRPLDGATAPSRGLDCDGQGAAIIASPITLTAPSSCTIPGHIEEMGFYNVSSFSGFCQLSSPTFSDLSLRFHQ